MGLILRCPSRKKIERTVRRAYTQRQRKQVKPLLIHIIIYTVFQLLACDFSPDFTYIDDIVKGCLASLDTAKKSTGTGGKKKGAAQFRIFNLGNTSPVDVSKLVSILEKLLKVKAKRRVLPMPRNGDVQYTHANISLAQRELGYKPTTDLESGLKKFVRWYITYQSKSKKKSSCKLVRRATLKFLLKVPGASIERDNFGIFDGLECSHERCKKLMRNTDMLISVMNVIINRNMGR
ncbi:unnamed protein product, partial [Vitis vinifera]